MLIAFWLSLLIELLSVILHNLYRNLTIFVSSCNAIAKHFTECTCSTGNILWWNFSSCSLLDDRSNYHNFALIFSIVAPSTDSSQIYFMLRIGFSSAKNDANLVQIVLSLPTLCLLKLTQLCYRNSQSAQA